MPRPAPIVMRSVLSIHNDNGRWPWQKHRPYSKRKKDKKMEKEPWRIEKEKMVEGFHGRNASDVKGKIVFAG